MSTKGIFLSDDSICGKPTVIGYDKRFRWRWIATQLNTFIFAVDFGDETVTVNAIEEFLTEAFAYAKKNYTGWPRGFQSGLGVIVILQSFSVSDEAVSYCRQLKSGKRWAGFSVPVTIDTSANQVHSFDHMPFWGWIYFPYFRKTIDELVG